ncbi:TolC family protein [Persephonella atlantica]|uniref:TolC family protein n=1 Tax=Persephonella atlantica TaxID=2699429 RepID=A0ABS1GHN8_9AQUI|nr:TolC family protein [Persephonella atlantica]MBK3332449.1 TolC family protein [Persephonella atlantica]
MFLIAVALLLLISGSVHSITLSKLISLAVENSPYIKESRIEKEMYHAEKKSIAAKKFGEVKLFGSFNHYEDKRILYPLSPPINPLTLKGAQNQLITGISYTLPVFTGFKIKNTVEIAKLKHILSSYRFYLTKNELVFNIRSLYLKTHSLEKQKEAIHSYIQSLNQLYRQLEISVKEGKKPEIDLLNRYGSCSFRMGIRS